MYETLTAKSGVAAVHEFLSKFDVQPSGDGLVFALPATNPYAEKIFIPNRLRDWLVDLRLLRHVPIAYYVPDAGLLPPESIRFFHVDPTWMDRMMDGVFAAANTGTVDAVFGYALLAMAREALDKDLAKLAAERFEGSTWTPAEGMTGMLIRSELVRRWPDLVVRAFKTTEEKPPELAILRAEPISKDLYIALFAGVPGRVHLGEPNVGIRFGVEPEKKPETAAIFEVDARLSNGKQGTGKVEVPVRSAARRTLNLAAFATKLFENTARAVALHLEQRPYVQVFRTPRPEETGSISTDTFRNTDGTFKTLALRKGRFMTVDGLHARMLEQKELNPKP